MPNVPSGWLSVVPDYHLMNVGPMIVAQATVGNLYGIWEKEGGAVTIDQ